MENKNKHFVYSDLQIFGDFSVATSNKRVPKFLNISTKYFLCDQLHLEQMNVMLQIFLYSTL